MTTEIYLCREGQALKTGRVEYSDTIQTRAEAEIDARDQCRRDPTIARVAYYAVAEDGSFRSIYSYHNPVTPGGGGGGDRGDGDDEKNGSGRPDGPYLIKRPRPL